MNDDVVRKYAVTTHCAAGPLASRSAPIRGTATPAPDIDIGRTRNPGSTTASVALPWGTERIPVAVVFGAVSVIVAPSTVSRTWSSLSDR